MIQSMPSPGTIGSEAGMNKDNHKPSGDIRRECQEFISETSLHGITHLAKAGWLLRVFWFLFLSVTFGLCVMELKGLVGEYIRNPSSTVITQVNEVDAPRLFLKLPVVVDAKNRIDSLGLADGKAVALGLLDHFLYYPSTGHACPETVSNLLPMWYYVMETMYINDPRQKYAATLNRFYTELQKNLTVQDAMFEWIAEEFSNANGSITKLYEKYIYPEWNQSIGGALAKPESESKAQEIGSTYAFIFDEWRETRHFADISVYNAAKGGPELKITFPNLTMVREGYIQIVTYACPKFEPINLIREDWDGALTLRLGSQNAGIDDHSHIKLACLHDHALGLNFFHETFTSQYCDPSIGLDPLTCIQSCWAESARRQNGAKKERRNTVQEPGTVESPGYVRQAPGEGTTCLPYLGNPTRQPDVPLCGFQTGPLQCDAAARRACKIACGQCLTCHTCQNLRVKAWGQSTKELPQHIQHSSDSILKGLTRIRLNLDRYTTVESVHYEPKYDPVIFLSAVGGLLGIAFGASAVSFVHAALFGGRLAFLAVKRACGGTRGGHR